jgi:thioredoxin reductase (NADPH)
LQCRGLGSFEPRKPLIEGINFYEKGIKYFIKDPEEFRNKRVVIAVEEILL